MDFENPLHIKHSHWIWHHAWRRQCCYLTSRKSYERAGSKVKKSCNLCHHPRWHQRRREGCWWRCLLSHLSKSRGFLENRTMKKNVNDIYKEKLWAITVDEAHVIKQWWVTDEIKKFYFMAWSFIFSEINWRIAKIFACLLYIPQVTIS